MALLAPWAANAQQAIPYSYGFENNDLSADGWELQGATSSYTGINSSAAQTGSYGFRFNYSEQSAYLVSPILTGGNNGIALTLSYKEYSNSYGDEQFQVGYTTDETVTDAANFTYGSVVTASLSWQNYEYTFPAGTKRIAVKYIYNDALYLYLDDFIFEAPSSCPKPTNLAYTLTSGNGTIADLSWTENGEASEWQICLNGDETNLITARTNPWQLTGLTPETTYTAKVRANCGSEQSGWSNEVTFKPTNAFSITVNDGTMTNDYVPYYAYYHDSQQRSEFIIPAASLETMAWGTITSMKFYPNYTYTTNASIQVYLMEVEATTFSDVTFYTEADATVVYNGTLTISPDGLTINFAGDGYEYGGGNLLVGFYQASSGSGYYTSSSCPFYGVTADGASISQYSSYSGVRSFLPKTTFGYLPGVVPTCFKPSGLEVARVTATTASLGWTAGADETQWQICLNDDETNLILVNENSYTLENLTPETDYTVKVRAYCAADDQSSWTANVSFTTDVACPAPTNVAVSDVTATSATISWTGDASSYNLRYREMTDEDFATITFYAEDVWQDGTGYQLLLDADANTYGTIIPETGGLTSSGDASAATYAEFEYKIPANADGAMTTSNVVIEETITIRIPAGTYDWCVTNPTPGDRIWIASSGGTIGGRYDDYEFRGGNTYEFHVYADASTGNDAVDLTVTEPGSAKDVVWTEINNVTSPYTLTVEPEKDYVVEVQADCDEYVSRWISVNFTTPSNCQVPTPLDVTDITGHSATLNWTGLQENYQVQYRTKGSREMLFFESFDSQPSTWTLTNAGYGTTSSATTDYLVFIGQSTTETAYLITPDLTDIVSEGTVEFKQRVYNGTATFQVGFSSTTNEVDAFEWGEEVSAAAVMFTAYDVRMPAGTKYVAIKSTTETETCAVLINDFGIYGNEIPAGEWNTATANATSYPISGLIAETEYEWQVRGENGSCEGGYTEWSELVTFTTDVSCPVPTDLYVDAITTESAVVTWESDAASIDIEVNGIVTEDVTSPYALVLEPGNYYKVRVRANCGAEDGYSEWSDVYAFYALCTAFDLPYVYGFEDATEEVNDFVCWSYGSANTANTCGLSYDGDNIVFQFSSFSSADDYTQVLISPELNAGDNEVPVQFYYRGTSTYGEETFKVGYSTTTNDIDAFTWGDEINTDGSTAWTLFNETFPAGTKYVAIYYYSDYQYHLYIDNLYFGTIVQTLNLTEGWNWFSSYIEMDDPIDLLDMLKESLGDNAEVIQAQDMNTEYDGEWWGDLDDFGIENNQTYMIYAANPCTVYIHGLPANPEDYTIEINEGWTWIGFPSAVEMDVLDVFDGFEAEMDDMIQAGDGTYTTYDGEWWGEFETMVPGQGYMYFSNSGDTKELIIPSVAKARANAFTPGVTPNINTKFHKQVYTGLIQLNNELAKKSQMPVQIQLYKTKN